MIKMNKFFKKKRVAMVKMSLHSNRNPNYDPHYTGWFCVTTCHKLELSERKEGASAEEMPP